MSDIALYDVLTKVGATPNEAKEAVADIISSKEVATKGDLVKLKTELLEKIADTKYTMVMWVVDADITLFLGLSGVIFATIGLLK